MISSMTGYGLSSSIEGDSEITIEIKGVNNKFLEISLKSHEINNDIDQKKLSLSIVPSCSPTVIIYQLFTAPLRESRTYVRTYLRTYVRTYVRT